MEITREYAEMIAKDFISNRNPNNWNGKGKNLKGFIQNVVHMTLAVRL